jgi:hypothetical protein
MGTGNRVKHWRVIRLKRLPALPSVEFVAAASGFLETLAFGEQLKVQLHYSES